MSYPCHCVIVSENYCQNEPMTETETYMRGVCGNCGSMVHFEPCALHLHNQNGNCSVEAGSRFDILRCPSCKLGTVANPMPGIDEMWGGIGESGRRKADFILSPGPLPAPLVRNMPADVEAAWLDAIRCGQVGAWTASELVCRKILMHVAVDQCGAKEGDSFWKYVDALDEARFFPASLKPVIDGIRQRGNTATHELAQSTETEARKTLDITHHVLRTIYELSI